MTMLRNRGRLVGFGTEGLGFGIGWFGRAVPNDIFGRLVETGLEPQSTCAVRR